jgi:hypothetical protein
LRAVNLRWLGVIDAVPHTCFCLCPSPMHEEPTPLIWAPGPRQHACSDIDCIHGHGLDVAAGFIEERLRLLGPERGCPV